MRGRKFASKQDIERHIANGFGAGAGDGYMPWLRVQDVPSRGRSWADSAPDHHDLPFFPDHEHARPDRNSDVRSPSFLYGNPFFDFKRLRQVSDERMRPTEKSR